MEELFLLVGNYFYLGCVTILIKIEVRGNFLLGITVDLLNLFKLFLFAIEIETKDNKAGDATFISYIDLKLLQNIKMELSFSNPSMCIKTIYFEF